MNRPSGAAPRVDQSMVGLSDRYYSECHAVFRRATNQSDLMLAEMDRLIGEANGSSILSVGSGTGLFEIPMLERMLDQDQIPARFVGIDIDAHACRTLRRRLRSSFGSPFEYRVHQQAFDGFDDQERFDLLLFVHTFEYLIDDPLGSLQRAHALLNPGGRMLIFSPLRGGINAIYEQHTAGCFSDDLDRLLQTAGLQYQGGLIEAECDIAALMSDSEVPRAPSNREAAQGLAEPSASAAHGAGTQPDHSERLALLSFLTQLDCRPLDPAQLKTFIDYYRSLRSPETGMVPHPTTAFLVAK